MAVICQSKTEHSDCAYFRFGCWCGYMDIGLAVQQRNVLVNQQITGGKGKGPVYYV